MRKSKVLYTAPEAGVGSRGESARIGYLLRQANTAHTLKVEKALLPYQLTLPQYSVLAVSAEHPGLSNADLARITLLKPQTVIVIVQNLEKLGTITRKAHPVHGRIQQIELTKKGRQLLEQSTQPVLRIQQELLTGFSQTEEAVIRRWLVSVAKSA